ncbi:MAG: hypothetical protein ACRC6M_09125, partial [Microcystaceae cyanobacterium]
MKNKLWQLTKAMPVLLGATLVAQSAIAAPEDNLALSPDLATTTKEVAPVATPELALPNSMPAIATQADGLDLVRRRQQLKKFNDSS